jgi:AraC-like DNA-binding protein
LGHIGAYLPFDVADIRLKRIGGLLLSTAIIPSASFSHRSRAGSVSAGDFVSVLFIHEGHLEVETAGRGVAVTPEDVCLLDSATSWTITTASDLVVQMMLVRKRLLVPFPVGATVRHPVAWLPVRRLVADLLALDDHALNEAQWSLAASALRNHLAGLFAPIAPGHADGGRRREADLLDRAIAHIDAKLTGEVTIRSLCTSLACSRSKLYRATAPVGGVAELIVRRRLAGAHRCLLDPGDRRSVAAIARTHGFTNPAQFSRRFRQFFGTTASSVRIGKDHSHPMRSGHDRLRVKDHGPVPPRNGG